MGYNVFITRKTDLTDEDGPIITLNEWKALVLSDTELRLESGAEEQGVCVWTAYSKNGRRRNFAWLYLDGGGNITAKNPDKEFLRKMCQIAQKLDAKVQGDELELYDAKGNVVRSLRRPLNLEQPSWILIGIWFAVSVLAFGGYLVSPRNLSPTLWVIVIICLAAPIFAAMRRLISK
jgi:hypothetical protein